jgi:hypothetical protein
MDLIKRLGQEIHPLGWLAMFIMPFFVTSLLLPPHALIDGGGVAHKLPSSNDAAFVSREICRSPPISLPLSLAGRKSHVLRTSAKDARRGAQ